MNWIITNFDNLRIAGWIAAITFLATITPQ
jgi:hypothetical protein